MPKPFDATTRFLVETDPKALLALLGLPGDNVELLNTDLSTVTAASDPLIHVLDPEPYIVHVEFQASYDPTIGRRMLRYSGLLIHLYDLPVASAVVLLRPSADGSEMTGVAEYAPPTGRGVHRLEYDVVRIWEKTVDEVLNAGVVMLPFAPLTNVPADALPSIVRRMEKRIGAETPPATASELWNAAHTLMGLKYSPEFAGALLKGVRAMEESSTYQATIAKGKAEGRAEEAHSFLLRIGKARFGEPDAATVNAIEAINDVEKLESLGVRAFEVETWSELFSEPG